MTLSDFHVGEQLLISNRYNQLREVFVVEKAKKAVKLKYADGMPFWIQDKGWDSVYYWTLIERLPRPKESTND